MSATRNTPSEDRHGAERHEQRQAGRNLPSSPPSTHP